MKNRSIFLPPRFRRPQSAQTTKNMYYFSWFLPPPPPPRPYSENTRSRCRVSETFVHFFLAAGSGVTLAGDLLNEGIHELIQS